MLQIEKRGDDYFIEGTDMRVLVIEEKQELSFMDWLGDHKDEFLEKVKPANQGWTTIEQYITLEDLKNLNKSEWLKRAYNGVPQELLDRYEQDYPKITSWD